MLAFTISGFWVSTSAIHLEPTIFWSQATAWVIHVVLKLGTSNSTLMLPLLSLVSIGSHSAVLTSFSRSCTFSIFFSLTSATSATSPSAIAATLSSMYTVFERLSSLG